jgi:hypothetical protein
MIFLWHVRAAILSKLIIIRLEAEPKGVASSLTTIGLASVPGSGNQQTPE